jgi:hypothetical protein
MLKEFDSVDANGKRSSTLYSHEGFKGHVVNHFVMLLSGLWTEGPVAEESLKKMTVGATDLFYKIENGYTSYAKGRSQGVMKPTDHGMPYSRTIWEDVVKPFHAAK